MNDSSRPKKTSKQTILPDCNTTKRSPWIQRECVFRTDEFGSNKVASSQQKTAESRALPYPLDKYNTKGYPKSYDEEMKEVW